MTLAEQCAQTLRPSAIFVEPCAVDGCKREASWTPEESLDHYCVGHVDEWLMAERDVASRHGVP